MSDPIPREQWGAWLAERLQISPSVWCNKCGFSGLKIEHDLSSRCAYIAVELPFDPLRDANHLDLCLAAMRERGWRLAAANDYDQDGRTHHFELWTHRDSCRYVQAEGTVEDFPTQLLGAMIVALGGVVDG